MPVIIEAHIFGQVEEVLRAYEETVAPLDESRLLHINVPGEDGFTVIEVWESEEALQRFLDIDLPPIWESVGMPEKMTAPPTWTIRPIHHVAVYRGMREPSTSR